MFEVIRSVSRCGLSPSRTDIEQVLRQDLTAIQAGSRVGTVSAEAGELSNMLYAVYLHEHGRSQLHGAKPRQCVPGGSHVTTVVAVGYVQLRPAFHIGTWVARVRYRGLVPNKYWEPTSVAKVQKVKQHDHADSWHVLHTLHDWAAAGRIGPPPGCGLDEFTPTLANRKQRGIEFDEQT